MELRIDQELTLLRTRYPALEYRADGYWIRLPDYPLTDGWSRRLTDVAFQIPTGFPGTPPYGIYIPAGLTFNGVRANNYTEPASTQPPFGGTWGILSWTPVDGQWRATTDLRSGSNLLNWAISLAERFKEGV